MNIKKLIFASIAVTLSGVILYVFASPSSTSFLTPSGWWHYSGNINISWNAATDADTYSIYLTDSWNNTTAIIEGTTSTGTILDSTSKSDWTYILTWKSCNSTGCTDFNPWINFIIDNTKPTINLSGNNTQIIEVKTIYIELWATANDNIDWDITTKINIDTSSVDTNTLWNYTVKYNVSDMAWNQADEKTRNIEVVDTTPPTIILNWSSTIYVEFWNNYHELGATWEDNADWTWDVYLISWTVNTWIIWIYNITYSYTDYSNNTGYNTRTVIVQDTTPPQISFSDPVSSSPTQSDTISVVWDDAIIKKRMYDDDWNCSTYSWDYTTDYIGDIIENTETNNWKYLCFYGEDTNWNITTLPSTHPIIIDITPPTYSWVNNWYYYNHDLNITYNDTNISGATLNGLSINSWDPIISEWNHTLIISDLAGNAIILNFTIDKTKPIISGFTNMWYHNTDITISYSDSNFSGATINWSGFSGNTTVSNEWTYNIYVEDLAGNYSTWTFKIDKTAPTATIKYSPNWPNLTNQDVIATITWFSEEITSLNTTGYTFTGNGSFTFEFQDLAGNTWSNVATVNRIDKSLPTVEQAFIYSWNTNTWNNWSWFYKGIISIKSKVYTNSGLAWISGSSCQYTLNWTDRNNADYDSTWWYCYVDDLDPQTDIDIIFSVSNDVWSTWTWENKQYFYDITSPTTTDDANSDWRNTDLTVTLTATDTWAWVSHTLYCTWTGSCTPTIIWTSATVTCPTNSVCTGLYVRYYSIDKVGNVEQTKTSPEIRIDKELPYITWTTSITSSNSNGSFAKAGDTVSITFTSHEDLPEKPIVKINSWWDMNFVSKITWSNTYIYERSMDLSDPEREIKINISMKDIAGNTWNYILTSNITYDRTPPLWINITQPTTHTYFQWGTEKTITRTTGSETNFWATPLVLQYSNDGRNTLHSTITTWASNNGSYNRTFPVLNSTLASVRIIATDLAGNVSYITWNNFTLDSTYPTDVSFTYPTAWEVYFKWWSGYLITWTWGTDDFLSWKVLEYLSGWDWTHIATYSTNVFEHLWITPNSGISANTWTVRLRITIYDRAWLNKTAETATFIIDSTMPNFFFNTNSDWRNTDAIWSTTIPTDNLAWIRSTGMLYRTDWPFTTNCDGWTGTIPIFTEEWTHTWYACVMDKAGNVRTKAQVYKIDKTAPIVHMPAAITTNTWKTINIDVNDGSWDVSWIQSYKWSKISGPWTITFYTGDDVKDPFVTADTDWHYVLQVVVKDYATNTTTWIIDFFWNATAPIITTWTITNTSSKTPTFTFTATDSGTLHWSWPCSSPTTTAVSGNNQITLSGLTNNTYNNCYVRIIDTMHNTWVWYNLPSFTVSYNPPSWWGGGGGGWWWGGWGFSIPTCTTQDLTCGIYGKYVLKSWVTCKWWDLWKTCGTDICVDWDYSWDPNDWICHDPTKVEANSWLTQSGTRETFKSPYNKELTDAYSYALGVKITTVPNIERADLTGVLIRSHLSKMMSEYAMKVLWKTPDTSRKCIFKDVDNQTDEFKKYARISCELWLMWLKTDWTPADTFDPDGKVTRAIFGTTLSRAIWWDKNNWWSNWYAKHLADLKAHWIMNQIDFPNNRELRWRVMLTMMRADQKLKQSKYSKFESLWNKKIFVPAKTKATKPSTNNNAENKITEKYSSSDKEFINWTNKNYQFYEWYTIWQSKLWVKYLQYFLKEQDYYTWSIDWINNTATVSALLEFQLKHKLITDSNDMAAWFLWPSTRAVINPLLKEILNK